MTDGLRELADAFQPTPGDPAAGLQLRQGVITALAAGPPPTVTVRIGKATTAVPGIRYHSAYIPAVSDVVFLVQNGSDVLCLGTLAAATAAILSPSAANLAYVVRGEVKSDKISAIETTTSAVFVDLATVGPAVTVTVGAAGRVLVALSADLQNATAGGTSLMGYAISGATVAVANTLQSISFTAAAVGYDQVFGNVFMVTGLAPGSTTFTAKYRTTAATTGQFASRCLTVIPL